MAVEKQTTQKSTIKLRRTVRLSVARHGQPPFLYNKHDFLSVKYLLLINPPFPAYLPPR